LKNPAKRRYISPDKKAKRLVAWGQKNLNRILDEPLDAQIGELGQVQRKIELLRRDISKTVGGKRGTYLRKFKELKAVRTVLIQAIQDGKKALRIQKSMKSKKA